MLEQHHTDEPDCKSWKQKNWQKKSKLDILYEWSATDGQGISGHIWQDNVLLM